MNLLKEISQRASKITEIPGLNLLSPSVEKEASEEDRQGFLAAQSLALEGAREISEMICEGWTEARAAKMLEVYLQDHGVQSYFHRAFVWYGENTRFRQVKKYKDFQSSQRRIREGEVMILDVAPIYKGYACDIGYSSCLGENAEYKKATDFLNQLKQEIPGMFVSNKRGSDIWNIVDQKIKDAGYDNIHKLYPMSVLGHRLYQCKEGFGFIQYLNFEWSSYWSLLSRGGFGQILSPYFEGGFVGLWAIEPHLGSKDFGIKFEEILVVDRNGAHWLSEERL